MKKLTHILPQPHVWLVAAVLLYLLSFLFEHSFSPSRSINLEARKLEAYIHAKQKEYNTFASDTALIKRLAEKRESNSEFNKFTAKTTGIFIFKKSILGIELLAWSNQKTYPPNDIFRFPDTTYFNFQENGYYICSKKTFERPERGDSLAVIGMIPVMYRYFAVLEEKFEHSESAASNVVIAGVPTDFPVKSISGNVLFYISPRTQSPIQSDDLANVLKLVAIFVLLLYIHFIAEQFARQYGFWKGLILLVVVLGILRLLTYYTTFPINLRQFEIFDPGVYASNPVHKSLGDLLINAILFCWIILFIWQKLDKTGFYNLPGGIKGTIIGIASSIVVVIFTFITAYTIRSLAADSSISFDVINFFSLTTFSVFGFIALSIIAVGYYYFIRIMVPLLSIAFKNNFYAVYLIAAVAGLSFLTFQIGNPLLSFYIIVLAWLIFYLWLSRLKRFGLNNQRQTMAGALFWIFIFSVSITAVIINANRQKEWQIMIIQADRIDRQTDPYNEKELNISFTFIDNDFLAPNFYRFTNEASAMFLRDSLMHKNRYLANYESRLYIFDANKNPLFNDVAGTFNELDAILRVQAKKTSVPHLFYYETAFDKYTFIFKQTVTDSTGKPIGYLFISADPERYNTGPLGATLFKHAGPADPDKSQVYSYGVYINGILST
ncbi:MAG TPA: hypothetical protein VFH07_00025, partial [Chitinophagaceae bacterium]|nr:hypothetical protein [Chitinophagaceae bacterium]